MEEGTAKAGAKNINLWEMKKSPGESGSLPWRQLLLHGGESTAPRVVQSGEDRIVCLAIRGKTLLLKCLDCETGYAAGGCARCGNNKLRVSVEVIGKETRILEWSLTCDKCGHSTGRTWICPRCGRSNLLHITTGSATKQQPTGKELRSVLHRDSKVLHDRSLSTTTLQKRN